MCRSLADNELSGQLPPAWLTNASFPALVDLYLSNNRLEGTLPSELLLGQLQVRTMLSAVTRKTDKGPLPMLRTSTECLGWQGIA